MTEQGKAMAKQSRPPRDPEQPAKEATESSAAAPVSKLPGSCNWRSRIVYRTTADRRGSFTPERHRSGAPRYSGGDVDWKSNGPDTRECIDRILHAGRRQRSEDPVDSHCCGFRTGRGCPSSLPFWSVC